MNLITFLGIAETPGKWEGLLDLYFAPWTCIATFQKSGVRKNPKSLLQNCLTPIIVILSKAKNLVWIIG